MTNYASTATLRDKNNKYKTPTKKDMAKKSTYYFTHDCNARSDEKILAVRMRHKAEGYAVYFMLVEMLAGETDHTLRKDYNMLAFELRVASDIVKSVVEDFGLFQFTDDGERFYSDSLNDRLEKLDNLREQRAKAGRKSAEKRAKATPVERPLQKESTTVDQNCNKGDIRDIISPNGERGRARTHAGGREAGDGDRGEREAGVRVGIMEGWKRHYKEVYGTDYLLTRGSVMQEVGDLAPAIESMMEKAHVELDEKSVAEYSHTLFTELLSTADAWQQEHWGLKLVTKQLNQLIKQHNGPRQQHKDEGPRKIADAADFVDRL